MLTVIIKRNSNPDDAQMVLKSVMGDMWAIKDSDILIEDSWREGIKKVHTPFMMLLEADCVLSGGYIGSNFGLMRQDSHNDLKGTGGYLKRAMLASCVGYEDFANRIYNYELHKIEEGADIRIRYWGIDLSREKRSTTPYAVQVGFVPGAIIRKSSLNELSKNFNWDDPNIIRMSTRLSFHFWDTGRRIQVNPNTTYVSNSTQVIEPAQFKFDRYDRAFNLFAKERI